MTKRILIVLLTTIGAVCLMFTIVTTSRHKYETKHGFDRIFRSGRLQLVSQIPAATPMYVAGTHDDILYFHTDAPSVLVYTDTTLKTLRTLSLAIDTAVGRYLANGFSTSVRYPEAFVFAYNMSAILVYNLESGKQAIIPAPSNYNSAVQIPDSTFILKYFTGDSTDQSFCKLNIFTKQVTKTDLLKEDLSSGGMLLYNEQNRYCYYIHHYNNRITIFDTAFLLIRSAHTIDTFTQNQVQYLSRNKTGSKDMLYKPAGSRMLINYLSQLHEGRLYINSLVKADNESLLTDKPETVIDVYNANTDNYIESFYLPVPHQQYLKSFRIFDNKILATYTNHIALYEFPRLSK